MFIPSDVTVQLKYKEDKYKSTLLLGAHEYKVINKIHLK